jgi:O-antigen/teichoic acid export membrane protein
VRVSASASPSDPGAPGPRFASHFIESVVLTWIGNAGRIVIGLVALRLVTGAIPEDALGAYWILTTVAALLSGFAELGLGLGVVRHLPLASSADEARRLMHTVLTLRVGVVAVVCAAMFAGKPLVLALFAAESLAPSYAYLYVFVVLVNLSELFTNFLQGRNRFRAIATVALCGSVLRLVLIVALVRGLRLGVPGLFLAEAAAMALATAASAALSGTGWRLGLDRDRARAQLRFGWPLYLNTLLSYTANRINTVLVGGLSTTAAVSYFSVANRVPDQLSFVLRAYVFVYLPSMSRLFAEPDTGPARRLLAASLRLMSFTFAMLALGLSLFRRELLGILAPESYQVAAAAVPLLLGGLVFSSLGLIMGNTFVAGGDSRTPVRINLWTSLLGLALNAVCIGRWGFMGAAWASLLYNAAAYAITDAVLSRRIRPAGRGYLAILAYLGVLCVAGLEVGIALRLGLLLLGGVGSLLLSPPLRADVRRVWRTRGGRAAGPPADV